jgi:anti-sigma factor RsiW
MTCREFVDFLMEYLEGGLEPQARTTFEDHMDDCPACVTYLDTYRETVQLGRQILCDPPDSPVPDDVPEDLVAAILAARRR